MVVFRKGHKNSKGEKAEWCIVSHKTKKILSSHKSKAAAKKHLQQMHIFKETIEILKKTVSQLVECVKSGKKKELNETIKAIKNNSCLNEFLNTTVPLPKLVKMINDELGYSFTIAPMAKTDSPKHPDFIHLENGTPDRLTKDDFNKINTFIKKYGYEGVRIFLNRILIEDIHVLENKEEFKYFIHLTPVPPQVIMKTGLRCQSFNKRLYLFAYRTKEDFEAAVKENGVTTSDYPTERPVKEDDDYAIEINNNVYVDENDRPIHFFTYQVIVPEHVAVHTDVEDMGAEHNNVYVTEPIKPENIRYIGY